MGLLKYLWLLGKFMALAFIFIGGGIIIPIASLMRHNRRGRAQEIVRKTFRFYLWALDASGMIDLSVVRSHDFENCAGKIVVANHLCLLDVVILMAYIPRAQCIIKGALWNHPFLGRLMRSAGYIRNDLDPELFIDQCKVSLAEGRTLIIFPQGTRTLPDAGINFQRGFANIAFFTKAPIQTVLITCNPLILYKDEPLLAVPSRRPKIRVSMGECLDKDFYLRYDRRSIAVRKIVDNLEVYYRKML